MTPFLWIITTWGFLSLLVGIFLVLFAILKELDWLKDFIVNVVTPWLNSISAVVNPDKK